MRKYQGKLDALQSWASLNPHPCWAALPYGVRIEIFQHFDVHNYQRLTRVSKEWKNDILLVPRYNCGTVFITWKNMRWPKSYDFHLDWSEWYNSKFDTLSWTELLGGGLTDIGHIVCEGGYPFVCFAGSSELTGLQPKLTFATFPRRLKRVTVINVLLRHIIPLFDGRQGSDLVFQRHSKIREFLSVVADSIVFVNLAYEVRSALYDLWMILRFGRPPIVDISMFRRNASELDTLQDGPSVVRQVARVVFDMDTYQTYSFGPEESFHFYPWFSDVLVSNRVLWNYPEAQSHWLQQCMDMLPTVTEETKIIDGWDFWTRDAVRYRLSVTGFVRQYLNVQQDAFPKSTVSFEGYQLDVFECEIFAAWFLATKDWHFRRRYYKYKKGSGDRSATFAKVHPNYPCPPCPMIGERPVPEEFPHDDWINKFTYLCTLRAQTTAYPHPTFLDAKNYVVEMNRRARRYFTYDVPRIIRGYRTELRYFFPRWRARNRLFHQRYATEDRTSSEPETSFVVDQP